VYGNICHLLQDFGLETEPVHHVAEHQNGDDDDERDVHCPPSFSPEERDGAPPEGGTGSPLPGEMSVPVTPASSRSRFRENGSLPLTAQKERLVRGISSAAHKRRMRTEKMKMGMKAKQNHLPAPRRGTHNKVV
jgi:hypothetical protein